MATVNYRVRGKKSPGNILVRLKQGDKFDFEISTGLQVELDHRSHDKQKVKNMHKKHLLILLMSAVVSISQVFSQELALYKQLDTTKLYVEVHYPEKMDKTKTYPGMIFFFGGGWSRGDRSKLENQAKYFAKRGLVTFLADYRTRTSNKTTPFESLKDAKSAMRFIRKNATKFNIDPNKIIASGGSAGGHLAAATALIDGYNEDTDDLTISCVPNALVLYNPVIDNGPGGYGYERIGESYKSFSPLHNIKKGAPPTIFFLGTKDRLIPVETAKYYAKVMEIVGSQCELRLYEGEGHGFFNYRNFDNYKKTVSETDVFLQSLGYLKKEPVVTIE